ncbi:MAG: chemotaxis receptor (MCP) glutamine deamidase CheD [Candidatus Azotimanducaceae bacterium]|jgi:chemotaxis receptor (MCP) glutamine deamidase CheD
MNYFMLPEEAEHWHAWGGDAVLENMRDIGKRNIDFVRQFFADEGLRLVAEDRGGKRPR